MKTVFSAFSSICEELIDASTTYQLALSHPRKVGFETGIRYALQSEINGCNLGEGFDMAYQRQSYKYDIEQINEEALSDLETILHRWLANIAAAGELAIQAGILPWPQGEAFRGVKECFEAWLQQRGSKQATEVIQGIDNLKTNLGMYIARNFEIWGMDGYRDTTTSSKYEVWGWKKRNQDDDWEFFVTEDGFKALTGGFHSRELKEALVNSGLMTLTDKGEFKKQYRVPSNGTKRLYHLTPNNIVG